MIKLTSERMLILGFSKTNKRSRFSSLLRYTNFEKEFKKIGHSGCQRWRYCILSCSTPKRRWLLCWKSTWYCGQSTTKNRSCFYSQANCSSPSNGTYRSCSSSNSNTSSSKSCSTKGKSPLLLIS